MDEKISHSESEMVPVVLNGARDGLEKLLVSHQRRLYIAIRSRIGNHQLAEDIVQDAFALAIKYWETYDPSRPFYNWIYRIARNVAVTDHRRRDRERCWLGRQWSLDANESSDEPNPITDQPDGALIRNENRQLVQAALDEVDPSFREPLVLYEFDQLNYAEIAELLSLPEGTVKSRIYRGRLQLREMLKQHFGDEFSMETTHP